MKYDNKKQNKNGINDDMRGVWYLLVGSLLFIATYTNLAGGLSYFCKIVMFRIIGVGVFIAPLYIFYIGIYITFLKKSLIHERLLFGISLESFAIVLFLSTLSIHSFVELGFSEIISKVANTNEISLSGGVIGHAIAYLFIKLIGFAGAYIFVTFMMILGLMLIFDYTLSDLFSIFSFDIIGETRKSSNSNYEKPSLNYPKKNNQYEYTRNNGKTENINSFSSYTEEHIPIYIENKDETTPTTFVEVNNYKNVNSKPNILFNGRKGGPTIELLEKGTSNTLTKEDKSEMFDKVSKIENALANFNIKTTIVNCIKGPAVSRFELKIENGVKVSKILGYKDDICLALGVKDVRIEVPIPGKPLVGIETPNLKQTPVYLRDILESSEFINANGNVVFALGKDITGKSEIADLSKLPHLLVAGTTGSGKSVFLNSIIISILYNYSEEEVKFILIDPKMVELTIYNKIPHLLKDVVTSAEEAIETLDWLVMEMERRYSILSKASVRNIDSYKELFKEGKVEKDMPFIVVIIDELADLMMNTFKKDTENYICRLAQLARACGIHLIVATQRPSVDVITGLIKSNIPSRVSFSMSSVTDSRTILDQGGAEALLGKGDMLYFPNGVKFPIRIQSAFVSEKEVSKIVNSFKK